MPTQLALPGMMGGLGHAHGSISIDTSLAERAAVTIKRVGRDMGESFKSLQTSVNRLGSDIKAMNRELMAIGAGAGLVTAFGLNAARDVRNYRVQFRALLKDEQEADRVMRSLTDQANDFGIEVNEVWQLGRSLIPVLEDGAESLDQWVTRAALLASTNPLKGTTDAVRAIQEYLAGQTISLQRLFNIDPNLIAEAQAQFEDVGEQLDFILGQMGANEDAARAMANEWVSLRNEIKMALAEGFTPLLETLAPLVRRFTNLLQNLRETNPEILSFGAGLITVVAVGAPLLVFLGKVIESLRTIKSLSIAGSLGKAGVYGAAVATGGAIGIEAVQAAGRATGNEQLQQYGIKDAIETIKKAILVVSDMLTKMAVIWVSVVAKGAAEFAKAITYATDALGQFASYLGEKLHIQELQEAGDNLSASSESLRAFIDEKLASFVGGGVESQRQFMESLTAALFPPGAEAAVGGEEPSVVTAPVGPDYTEALAVFEDYQAERIAIEEETELRRNEIIQAAADERAAIEERILQAEIDYSQQEARYEQDYYRNRMERAQAASEEMARAEEDHQRKMRRLQEDSQARQDTMIETRDALGLRRERRKYEVARQRAEEDHAVAMSRRNAAFALEMAQMEAHFQIQRARREQDFAEQQSRLNEEFALVNVRRDEELELLRTTTEAELDNLERAALERIGTIDATLVAGMNVITASAVTTGQMLAWLEQQRQALAGGLGGGRPGPISGYASGGYASGIIRTGEQGYEFVLDAATTRAAERMVGGRLTQQNVLGVQRGGGQLAIYQNFTFHGDMSAEMRQWYRNTARAEATAAFQEVMG